MYYKLIALALGGFFLSLAACGGEQNQDTASKQETAETIAPSLDEEAAILLSHGSSAIDAAMQTLSSNLQAAMKEGGPEYALSYCQTAALPLSDSISRAYGVEVYRKSLKNRNLANVPDAEEIARIAHYQEALDKGEKLKPIIEKDTQGNWHLTKPIILAEACLKCHGKSGETLSKKQEAAILALYPEDKARGYELGELRGIWSLRFRPKDWKNR